jgi:hypothetical protein
LIRASHNRNAGRKYGKQSIVGRLICHLTRTLATKATHPTVNWCIIEEQYTGVLYAQRQGHQTVIPEDTHASTSDTR